MNWFDDRLQKKVREIDTPFYLYDLDYLTQHLRDFKQSIPSFEKVYFAIMANYNRDVLTTVLGEDVGLFCHSMSNIDWGLKVGFRPEQIVCAGTNHSLEESTDIVNADVYYFANSPNQLRQYRKLASGKSLGIRVNIGGLLHWAGLSGADNDPAPRIGFEPLELLGLNRSDLAAVTALHIYAGTNLVEHEWYIKILETLSTLSGHLPNCEVIDIGGGFSVGYGEGVDFDLPLLDEGISKMTRRLHKVQGKAPQFWCEPGRYLAATCGIKVVTVTDVFVRGGLRYVGVDSTMASFPRTFIYDASGEPLKVLGKEFEPLSHLPTIICGATTYSKDYLSAPLMLPEITIGDRIAFGQTGAYQYSMSMDFLGRERPAEYVKKEGRIRLSRRAMLPAGYSGFEPVPASGK